MEAVPAKTKNRKKEFLFPFMQNRELKNNFPHPCFTKQCINSL